MGHDGAITIVIRAVILLAATLVALIWANSPWRDTYQALWSTELSLGLGEIGVSYELGSHASRHRCHKSERGDQTGE